MGSLRDVVIAHKEQWLMEKLGSRPHFATIIGVQHVGLEEKVLAAPHERIEYLKSFKSVLRRLFEKKQFYSIAQFAPSEQGFIRHDDEVPELKELVMD